MNLRLAALRLTVDGLGTSWRFRARGVENLEQLRQSGRPFIYAIWHCQILPLIWFHRRTRASLVISAHRDGGILADAASSWGFGLIRGSSTRGGAGAVRGILRALEAGDDVAMTPDGPRGPALSVKPGIVRAAERAGVPILPVRADVDHAWRLDSWDRFEIPRPFAAIQVTYRPAIEVQRLGGFERARVALQSALNGERETLC